MRVSGLLPLATVRLIIDNNKSTRQSSIYITTCFNTFSAYGDIVFEFLTIAVSNRFYSKTVRSTEV